MTNSEVTLKHDTYYLAGWRVSGLLSVRENGMTNIFSQLLSDYSGLPFHFWTVIDVGAPVSICLIRSGS